MTQRVTGIDGAGSKTRAIVADDSAPQLPRA
jgi:N-acetylglucosamine kinase-like BadF-type ATPase